jgi:predicted CXXCH cytochrome family protein
MRLAVKLVPVVALMFGTTAFGQIMNSDHDLRTELSGLNEICLPCHTPHGSDTTVTDAPLWNHQVTTATFQMYTTISGRTGDPNGASKLCLSCHDGITAMDNYGGNTGGTIVMTGDHAIGTDLRNDHPIGLSYPPPTGQYATAATVKAAGLRLPNDGTNDRIECQSCHDPHLTTNGEFLRMSNTDSALCRTCHTL